MSSRYREHIRVDHLALESEKQVQLASPPSPADSSKKGLWAIARSFLMLLCLAVLILQCYFLVRIVLMNWINPESTSFQRSEILRILTSDTPLNWRQQWVPYEQMSSHIKRAVIASEDAEFVEHYGVDWKALEAAAQRNTLAQERAEKRLEKLKAQEQKRLRKQGGNAKNSSLEESETPTVPVKIVGGSTISQQLAKNLFLSGERHLLRKAQEIVITFMLEAFLSKKRILEIYLNSVEWGEGVFGVEAASQFYFKKPASDLSPYQAARLAVMLPRPRFYQKKPQSAYLHQRATRIASQLDRVELP